MAKLTQKLESRYAIDGITEYSKRAVSDYWDAGVATGSGLALTQYGSDVFGDSQLIIALLGSALSATGSFVRDCGGIGNLWKGNGPYEAYSFGRNMFAGFSGFLIGSDSHGSLFNLTPNTFLEYGSIAMAGLGEYLRRLNQTQDISTTPPEQSVA